MTCGLWRISPPKITYQVANGEISSDKPIEDVKIGYHFFSEMINRTVWGHSEVTFGVTFEVKMIENLYQNVISGN